MGFDRSPFFLVGVGYQWNSWLRFDVTGEYRAKANFTARIMSPSSTASARPCWWIISAPASPSGGAGQRLSRPRHMVEHDPVRGRRSRLLPQPDRRLSRRRSGLQSSGPFTAVALGDQGVKWNFAWALHAGVAYTVRRPSRSIWRIAISIWASRRPGPRGPSITALPMAGRSLSMVSSRTT